MPELMFEIKAVAHGEVRAGPNDPNGLEEGTLISSTDDVHTRIVSASQLAKKSDDALRAAGLDDATIAQIRSTT